MEFETKSAEEYTALAETIAADHGVALRRITQLEKACELALKFWHSDHPNDTVEAIEAEQFIKDVLAAK